MIRRLTGSVRPGSLLLLASLCLNVLLAAYVATQWIDRWRMPLITAGPTRLMEAIARRLPNADADVLWRVYRGKETEVSAAQAEYRSALADAVKLLAQPELDMEAVRAAVTKARAERIEVGDLSIAVILEALPQMSAEGRVRLISRLRRQ